MLFNFSKLRTAMKFSNPHISNLSHPHNPNANPKQTPNSEILFAKLKHGLFCGYGTLSLCFTGTGIYMSIFKEDELIKKFGGQEIQKKKIASCVIL